MLITDALFVFGNMLPVLIVDATVVANGARSIQYERLRRALRAKLVGHVVIRILQQRNGQLVTLCEPRQVGYRILAIGVDR